MTGRLQQDLAKLTQETLVTPTDRFYIRTSAPASLPDPSTWSVRVGGLVDRERTVPIEAIAERAVDQGVHLMECSGNSGAFGLMSTAQWDGVPLLQFLDGVERGDGATRVLVEGYDEHTGRAGNSTRGASWVFSFEDLAKTGAFLATRMNGDALPRDHGQPVRLVVPGWYGCTCIKWVNEVRLVDDTTRRTTQMREFASRTHQRGRPELAKDYRPATIQFTAMPVRVEVWRSGEETVHRVVGIAWGGERTTDRLQIQIGRGEAWADVDSFEHETTTSWTLWSHTWRNAPRGEHRIRMRVDDSSMPTRRLDSGFYGRTVRIV